LAQNKFKSWLGLGVFSLLIGFKTNSKVGLGWDSRFLIGSNKFEKLACVGIPGSLLAKIWLGLGLVGLGRPGALIGSQKKNSSKAWVGLGSPDWSNQI
jgi:hypothetical protein